MFNSLMQSSSSSLQILMLQSSLQLRKSGMVEIGAMREERRIKGGCTVTLIFVMDLIMSLQSVRLLVHSTSIQNYIIYAKSTLVLYFNGRHNSLLI